MPREVTPCISRGAEPDEQLPKYGLRKRTAHGTVSNGKNLEDDNHQTLAKRTKRTFTNTRAQSSSLRGSVGKRTRVSSGQGWAKSNKNREWLAEAILQENDTQYLIKYEPVSQGAQHEISWQPKGNANAALVAWWEEHKMASAHENSNGERDNDPTLTKKEDGTRQRRSLMAHGGQLQNPVTDHQSLERYVTESVDSQQCSADLVDKRTSGGLEETSHSTIIPEILDILAPERDVPVAHMYETAASKNRGAACARPCVKDGRIVPAAVEDKNCCEESQLRDGMATQARFGRSQSKSPKVALSAGHHLEKSADSQQLPRTDEEKSGYVLVADETQELELSLVAAANACVSQNRKDNTHANAAYGVRINEHSRTEGLGQILQGYVTKREGQERLSPRPGTSISTILSPAPSALSDNMKDNGTATHAREDSSQALLRKLAYVEVSKNRDPGIPDAVLGRLPRAREQLRLLLLGSGRKRSRKFSSRFLPSP
jgi:hypothetical protein